MSEGELLYNAIKTPDGTILESRHRHDYKSYVDSNGETYVTDGGLSYTRRSVNKEPYEELSVYTDDPHEKIREVFSWGSRGKKGDEPLKYILLKDITDEHLEALIGYTEDHSYPDKIKKVFLDEKTYRNTRYSLDRWV